MKVKLFTKDIDTMEFLQANIYYYDIKKEIIPVYNEDGTIRSTCYILFDISSIDYNKNDNSISIYYKNIRFSIKTDNINDLIVDNK